MVARQETRVDFRRLAKVKILGKTTRALTAPPVHRHAKHLAVSDD